MTEIDTFDVYIERPPGFRTSAQLREAQNYTMPALSPTMSEGNIANWKIKEGDSFSVGDVILEIETDKATMDVEAQDDGVLFKIMHGDGAKGVKVGERIAVFAEQGDDLQSLEIPAEDKSKIQSQPEQKEESAPKEEQTSQAADKKEESSEKQAESSASGSPTKDQSTVSTGSKPQKQTYPLFPAVQQLLHQNGYQNEEADKISATGPNGRILKGDVLAYLGRISKDYPAKESERLEKQAHLDLSNITPAKPKPEEAKQEQKPAAAEPEAPTETEIAVPISLSAVIATQKRVQDSLGIFLPLSTFIARASELANEDLPAGKGRKPSADDLFNSVLGLDRVSQKSLRGHFIPQIIGISPPPLAAPGVVVKKPDIIDILAQKPAKVKVPKIPAVPPAAVGVSAHGNIFSVTAQSGDEARATEYLERMKLALEKEPGRLVL